MFCKVNKDVDRFMTIDIEKEVASSKEDSQHFLMKTHSYLQSKSNAYK